MPLRIKLPKYLVGFAYDQVLPVDLNTFDVDILLPSLFFKVISDGRDRKRTPNDPTRVREYVTKLTEHPDIVGFEGPIGFRLMDRLVRTALVQIGTIGVAQRGEQIQGLTGYTLLVFKPGFPTSRSLLRRVDDLLYRMMHEQFRGNTGLVEFFRQIFGHGLNLHGGYEPNGHYDGVTELDTMTRLSIALVDGFASTTVANTRNRTAHEACPALAAAMARDIHRYLKTYSDRMPIEALTHHLKALINLELFIYTLKLWYAIIELVERRDELPAAMQRKLQVSPPEVYLDFTGSRSALSGEMAGVCVRRDLEAIQRFIPANLKLRHLDRYVQRLRRDHRVGQAISAALSGDGGPDYLQALLSLLDDPEVFRRIDAASEHDEDEIRRANSAPERGEDIDPENEELVRIMASGDPPFDRLVQVGANLPAVYPGEAGAGRSGAAPV